MRFRYSDYPTDLVRGLLTYQELVKLFLQIVLQTGGDVEEALKWMKYLQERGMIDENIDLDAFRKELQKNEIVEDRDGSLAQAPIALVEVQGYVFDAKVRMAGLAERLGDHDLATRLASEAEALRARFDAAFWMPDVDYYAVALDRDKRQVGSITSNPGHCLWSGIVPKERVNAVVDRLLDPTMDCGWGIRTYASGQPGYNPVGYHTGTVWPHDNALIAAGMKRVGRHDASDRIASRIFEAAQHSPDFRLPELFCGFDRGVGDAPGPSPAASSRSATASYGSPAASTTAMHSNGWSASSRKPSRSCSRGRGKESLPCDRMISSYSWKRKATR